MQRLIQILIFLPVVAMAQTATTAPPSIGYYRLGGPGTPWDYPLYVDQDLFAVVPCPECPKDSNGNVTKKLVAKIAKGDPGPAGAAGTAGATGAAGSCAATSELAFSDVAKPLAIDFNPPNDTAHAVTIEAPDARQTSIKLKLPAGDPDPSQTTYTLVVTQVAPGVWQLGFK